ncbi:MAG: head-tail connector protein [Candidatus Gastranaerophilaceae bacterium]|jgi:hypothetical protein|nr:head-tail connector protein [Christensenellales bacterium]
MLDKVKNVLRIKTTAYDNEVQGLIDACKADLRLVGVEVPETPDTLITRAIMLYAKANFGYSDDSEKYQKAYDHLKCSLSLAGDYNAAI